MFNQIMPEDKKDSKIYHIAIDVSPLSDGNSVRGVGEYTNNLTQYLQSEIKTNPKYKNYKIDLITDPKNYSRDSYDLIHYPYFDPFKLTLPSKHIIPFIVTCHDLIPIEFKSHFPVGIKGNIKWLIQKNNLKKASYIITVSHYSKNSISDLIKYPQDQIYPTYLGASSSFSPKNNSSQLQKIQKKYNLPDKFILFVGDANWNKNVPTLVKACIELNIPLVIVGSSISKPAPIHPWTEDIHWVQQKYQQLGGAANKSLILTGFVPDEDLPYIYNLAHAYCQPSFAEGFGIPMLEAMQSACPVIYSNTGALAEIMDFSGIMFDPNSINSLKQAISKLDDKDLRLQTIKKGLLRSKIFNWKYTAIQTLAVYELALINEKEH